MPLPGDARVSAIGEPALAGPPTAARALGGARGGHVVVGRRDEAALERVQRLIARERELEKKLRALEQKLVAIG